MKYNQKFSKYQWVEMRVQKARSDSRVESYNPDRDSINAIPGVLPTDGQWEARKNLIFPLRSSSMCALQRIRDERGEPTLGLFKPTAIRRLRVEPDEPDWTPDQKQALQQMHMFDAEPPEELEKIPFKFIYDFDCADPQCNGHQMTCTDWEMSELYRKVRLSHGDDWEAPFRQRYEDEMIHKYDTHFYVGTIHQHPGSWIIVGVFYPMRIIQTDLFQPR
ncbi:MAG: hypothetical protein WAU82_04155 [Candidatus Binatus sp.]|uniref:hypothetical protein n=1 Tax=Candidatus Binatus sp. TaxID=2811406 RepID=UPI003BAF31A3